MIAHQEPYIVLDQETEDNHVKNSYYYSAYPPIQNKHYSFSNYQENKYPD